MAAWVVAAARGRPAAAAAAATTPLWTLGRAGHAGRAAAAAAGRPAWTSGRAGLRTTSAGQPNGGGVSRMGNAIALGAAVLGGTAVWSALDTRSWINRNLLMKVVQLFDGETAHRLAVLVAAIDLAPRDQKPDPFILRTSVFGMDFSNPVGLAAGFDKHGEAMGGMLKMGFGFVEVLPLHQVGSVTPLPQPGNAKPRVFRLLADRAVINRYGFNSDGMDAVEKRLRLYTEHPHPPGILGVNIGKNKEQTDTVSDYVRGVQQLGPYAQYLVVNVSSPNTPGLRALQGRDQLRELLKPVLQARERLPNHPPLLVKIAPDLTEEDLRDVATVALETKVDGLIISNTTITRPASLVSPPQLTEQAGGLSGAPLFEPSTQVLEQMYILTEGAIPLIGVGGISTGQEAYTKIRKGASLVQLYTSLSLEGPAVVARVKDELAALLAADGFRSVADAVGVDVPSVRHRVS